MRFSASWKKSIDSALFVKIALINELQMLLANTYYIGHKTNSFRAAIKFR
jgi:hypothetical protein